MQEEKLECMQNLCYYSTKLDVEPEYQLTYNQTLIYQ